MDGRIATRRAGGVIGSPENLLWRNQKTAALLHVLTEETRSALENVRHEIDFDPARKRRAPPAPIVGNVVDRLGIHALHLRVPIHIVHEKIVVEVDVAHLRRKLWV